MPVVNDPTQPGYDPGTEKEANEAIGKILKADEPTADAIENLKASLLKLKPAFEVGQGAFARFIKERGRTIPEQDRERMEYFIGEIGTAFARETWTNQDVGDFIMLKAIMIEEATRKVFELYAPQLLQYLPAVMLASI